METVNSWVLNTSLDDVIQIMGIRSPPVSRPERTPDGLQKMGTVTLFPFGPTHLDRPPMWHHGDRDEGEGDLLDEEPRGTTPPYLKFASTVIVDLSSRAQTMWDALKEARDQGTISDELPTTPTFCWPDGKLADLYKAMTIEKDDIVWLKDLNPDAILFCTRWRQFVPPGADLLSIEYAPWHPYLLHPFLSPDAIDCMMSRDNFPNLTLLGCDLLGLDSPLRNMILNKSPATGQKPRPIYREPKNARLRSELERIDAWKERHQDRESFRKLHKRAGEVEPRKLLLEQLVIPPELLADPSVEIMNGATIRCGALFVLTHEMNSKGDVALASVQFVPDSEMGRAQTR